MRTDTHTHSSHCPQAKMSVRAGRQFCNRICIFLATQSVVAAMKRETAYAINRACQQVSVKPRRQRTHPREQGTRTHALKQRSTHACPHTHTRTQQTYALYAAEQEHHGQSEPEAAAKPRQPQPELPTLTCVNVGCNATMTYQLGMVILLCWDCNARNIIPQIQN